MSLRVVGRDGKVTQVDGSHRALRGTLLPADSEQLDHYICSLNHDQTAAISAGADVCSIYNRSLDRVAVIYKIDVSVAHKSTSLANVGPFGLHFQRYSTRHRVSLSSASIVTPVSCYSRQGGKQPGLECVVIDSGSAGLSFASDPEITPNAQDQSFAYTMFLMSTSPGAGNCPVQRATAFSVRAPWDYPMVLPPGEWIRVQWDGNSTSTLRSFFNITVHWFEATATQAANLGFA